MLYAAIISETINYPSDETSRTRPGHGYPAYSATVQKFKPFTTEDDMLTWVQQQSQYAKYSIIRYEDVKIKTTLTVEVDK